MWLTPGRASGRIKGCSKTLHDNNIVKEGCVPDDWRKSILVPVYKGKGDSLVCGSYRAIKLLEQPTKVFERVLEMRIIWQMSIEHAIWLHTWQGNH